MTSKAAKNAKCPLFALRKFSWLQTTFFRHDFEWLTFCEGLYARSYALSSLLMCPPFTWWKYGNLIIVFISLQSYYYSFVENRLCLTNVIRWYVPLASCIQIRYPFFPMRYKPVIPMKVFFISLGISIPSIVKCMNIVAEVTKCQFMFHSLQKCEFTALNIQSWNKPSANIITQCTWIIAKHLTISLLPCE